MIVMSWVQKFIYFLSFFIAFLIDNSKFLKSQTKIFTAKINYKIYNKNGLYITISNILYNYIKQ